MRALLLAAALAAAPALDADRDGYPDAAQLRSEDDRGAFVESFVAIARAQVRALDAGFDPSQRDCAGLVRYAWREALKPHDAGFAARHPGLRRLPEVRAFSYPNIPVIGTRLFRIAPGPFRSAKEMSPTAEARLLVAHSTLPVAGRPRAGDLVFFDRPTGAHLMILVEGGDDPAVVYHTGPSAQGQGEVRLARLSSLASFADPTWHPSRTNPCFRGFWRPKILEGP